MDAISLNSSSVHLCAASNVSGFPHHLLLVCTYVRDISAIVHWPCLILACSLTVFSLAVPKGIWQRISWRCPCQAESVEVKTQRSDFTRHCICYCYCKWGGLKVPPFWALGEERHCRHSEGILWSCHCSWWFSENAGTWEENDGDTVTWRFVGVVGVVGTYLHCACMCAFVTLCI